MGTDPSGMQGPGAEGTNANDCPRPHLTDAERDEITKEHEDWNDKNPENATKVFYSDRQLAARLAAKTTNATTGGYGKFGFSSTSYAGSLQNRNTI